MSFETQSSDSGMRTSPGGFIFGVEGHTFGPAVPTSITWFLDGSAMVCDQYGRRIRGVVTPDGLVARFADGPPDASREGDVVPRPEFATHAQVVAALAAERIDWLAYTVQYRAKDGSIRAHAGMSKADADKMRTRLLREGVGAVAMARTIACSGWPQLPYDELIKLPELPPTPIEELRKIRDPQMRKDALRARRELDSARATEYAAAEAE